MSGMDEYEEAREFALRTTGIDVGSPEWVAKLPGSEPWNACMLGNCGCPAGEHRGGRS